jgi:arabinan endo-1,5-alpha-L-arabinosidase
MNIFGVDLRKAGQPYGSILLPCIVLLLVMVRCIAAQSSMAAPAGATPAEAAVSSANPAPPPPVSARDGLFGAIKGVHDPTMIKQGDTWYVFSTAGGNLPIRCSKDLMEWKKCGRVFADVPAWIHAKIPDLRDLWAPDVSFEDGEYRVYYCYSVWGQNASGIALVTNKTLDSTSPDYMWVDHGMVLESNGQDNFNAIDPNFFRDPQGRDWLDFGSFWTGIKMRRLGADGKLFSADTRLYALASREQPDTEDVTAGRPFVPHAIEAPFLVHHGAYFYLFTSWDRCCSGAGSTYRVMVGRSKLVTGPYVDEHGQQLMDGGGTELLGGNAEWAARGGESVWRDAAGRDVLVYHAYARDNSGHYLQISPIIWQDDWPVVVAAK